jgi:hypothetical protein
VVSARIQHVLSEMNAGFRLAPRTIAAGRDAPRQQARVARKLEDVIRAVLFAGRPLQVYPRYLRTDLPVLNELVEQASTISMAIAASRTAVATPRLSRAMTAR